MKKSLLAVAVAAALPGVAFAQSNVTISGFIKMGVANNAYSSSPAAANSNGWGIMEGSSRIIFSGVEDLGGGLKAIWQLDQRYKPDNPTGLSVTGTTPAASPIANGNTWAGLMGNWGTFKMGRHDLYYGNGTDGVGSDATALQHWNYSILGYVGNNTIAIANGTRTPNVLRYESPMWNGFYGNLSYSFSPLQPIEYQAGIGSSSSRGGGGSIELGYKQGAIDGILQYWGAKNPTSGGTTINTFPGAQTVTPTQNKQESWRIGGNYNFGIVKVGLTYDDSAYFEPTGAFAKHQRSAWAIPVSAPLGAGVGYFTYTQAGDVKIAGNTLSDSGAQMFTLGYNYPFSKRTSVGFSVTRINNDTNASYGMFTGAATSLGDTTPPKNGQNVTSWYFGLKHSY